MAPMVERASRGCRLMFRARWRRTGGVAGDVGVPSHRLDPEACRSVDGLAGTLAFVFSLGIDRFVMPRYDPAVFSTV